MGIGSSFSSLTRKIFLKKGDDFFELFSQQVILVGQAAKILGVMVSQPSQAVVLYPQLKEIEVAGDDYLRIVYETVAHRFVTPIDREDIILLARNLDDIIDTVDSVGKRMAVLSKRLMGSFKIFDPLLLPTEKLTRVLAAATKELPRAIKHLSKSQRMPEVHSVIHALENQADEFWDGEGGIRDLYYQFLIEKPGQALTRSDLLLGEWVILSHAIEDATDLVKNTVDHIATVIEKFA